MYRINPVSHTSVCTANSRTNIPGAKIATYIASERDFDIEVKLLNKDESDWSVILPQKGKNII